MSDFWIFVNLREYDKVLNIRQDTIMEDFRECQVSAYTSVAQGSELAWIGLNNA